MTKEKLKELLKHGKIITTDRMVVLKENNPMSLLESEIDSMQLQELGEGKYKLYLDSDFGTRRVIKLEVK